MERAPFAFAALHPDLSPHQFNQTYRDRQPQAGASVFARGAAVGLRKGFEQQPLFLERNSDARILHFEMEFHSFVVLCASLNGDQHFPLLGELDGVTHQVHQNLPQATGIAEQMRGHIRIGIVGQFQFFLVSSQCHGLHGLAHAVVQVEFDRLQIQLAGFDLEKSRMSLITDNSDSPKTSPATGSPAARC